jgi:hypothetical protein
MYDSSWHVHSRNQAVCYAPFKLHMLVKLSIGLLLTRESEHKQLVNLCGGTLYLLLKLAVSPCLFAFGLYMYYVVYDICVQTYHNKLMTYRNL